MMYADYEIAGHGVRILGRCARMECVSAFGVFRSSPPLREEDIVMNFHSDCDMPGRISILESCRPLYDFTFEGKRGRFMAGADFEGFLMTGVDGTVAGWYHPHGSRDFYSNAAAHGEPDYALLRFMLWVAFGVATAHLSTVAIHSSAVVCDGRAVMFLGESGTGKSTHTRLWCENIEGARLLNDDSPILRVESGRVMLHGSPWSGKTPCYRRESYPLAGVVRLSQAPRNRMVRLGRLAGLGALQPSCPPEFNYFEPLADAIYSTLGDVLGTVPVWHLECLPEADAARLAYETIFGVR